MVLLEVCFIPSLVFFDLTSNHESYIFCHNEAKIISFLQIIYVFIEFFQIIYFWLSPLGFPIRYFRLPIFALLHFFADEAHRKAKSVYNQVKAFIEF